MLFNTLLEGEAAPGLEAYSGIIVMVLLFVAMYFFMIRPQKKQEKKDAEMRQNLAVGDEVTTIGGIIGKVVSIKDEQTLPLKLWNPRKLKLRMLRQLIPRKRNNLNIF